MVDISDLSENLVDPVVGLVGVCVGQRLEDRRPSTEFVQRLGQAAQALERRAQVVVGVPEGDLKLNLVGVRTGQLLEP